MDAFSNSVYPHRTSCILKYDPQKLWLQTLLSNEMGSIDELAMQLMNGKPLILGDEVTAV